MNLLPLASEPLTAPTDRDMMPSERREFVRTHRTCIFGYGRRSDGPAMSVVYYIPTDSDELLVSTMRERAKAKSISAETTFETDVSSRSELEKVLKKLSERVGTRLRRSGQRARGTTIKLRYGDFTTITRQRTFAAPGDGDQIIRATIPSEVFERSLIGK